MKKKKVTHARHKDQHPSLYAAQRHVRNAFAHMYAHSLEETTQYWRIDEKKQRKRDLLEIRELGISFDERALHGKQFNWKDLGGFNKFLEILDYLVLDLQNRQKNNRAPA